MSQEDIKAEIAREALQLCRSRIRTDSGVATPDILDSIQAQLQWLVAYFEGENNEREKLKSLVFGHYAAREIDEKDEEFVSALHKAFYVADKTAAGLKIDMKVIQKGS